MAITCPKCGAEFDATLFQFGHSVRCDCGTEVEYPGAGLGAGHVAAAREARWEVWRQGDDGNAFLVRDGLTEKEADELVALLESRGHKQLYWKSRRG
jgi:hypothetical protein